MRSHPFIQRWQNSAAAERANYQFFLSELCDFLDVPRPNPAVAEERDNQYVFERPSLPPPHRPHQYRLHRSLQACFKAFGDERDLPASVWGPVDLSELAWLAATCLAVAI
jgi:hypothetical protein